MSEHGGMDEPLQQGGGDSVVPGGGEQDGPETQGEGVRLAESVRFYSMYFQSTSQGRVNGFINSFIDFIDTTLKLVSGV